MASTWICKLQASLLFIVFWDEWLLAQELRGGILS